jgi:ornithine cyclodeaminase/alanine dehydrogenase-like protein (mu-crystallin family)
LVLLLTEDDVEGLIDVPSAVKAIEAAFLESGRGKAITPARSRLILPNSFGTIRLMPAALVDSKVSGLKVLAGTAGRRRPGENYFVTQLHDYDDGALKCLVSANRLTQLRTGAISAVATRALARKDSEVLGLIGAGVQGRGQLEAIGSVMKFKEGYVYDISKESAMKLVEFASSRMGMSLRMAESVEEVTKNSDVVSTSTTSSSPFLSSANVTAGTHLNAIGSNLPSRRELDASLLMAAKVVVDSSEHAIDESGDLEPIRQGSVPRERIHAELAEVLTGSKPGRESESEITIFKSVGVALQDVAIANFIYERAVAKGVGREIAL